MHRAAQWIKVCAFFKCIPLFLFIAMELSLTGFLRAGPSAQGG